MGPVPRPRCWTAARRSRARPIRERPVAAYELAAIARPIALGTSHVGKSDPRAEAQTRRIAREDRVCRGVALGFDKCERGGSRCAEHPLDIGGHAEMTGEVRFVRQPEARYLYRSFDRHVLKKIGGDAMRAVLEAAVAQAMTGDIDSREVANGNRCRAPDVAGPVVPHIESLAWGVADRIVRPGGELVLTAIG